VVLELEPEGIREPLPETLEGTEEEAELDHVGEVVVDDLLEGGK
jgi:hypothetical protein